MGKLTDLRKALQSGEITTVYGLLLQFNDYEKQALVLISETLIKFCNSESTRKILFTPAGKFITDPSTHDIDLLMKLGSYSSVELTSFLEHLPPHLEHLRPIIAEILNSNDTPLPYPAMQYDIDTLDSSEISETSEAHEAF